MIVRTFWVWHKAEDGPDCEFAWSQPSIDNNPDGWEQMKKERLQAYGSGVHSHREIELRVSYDAILRHWLPDPTDAEVVPLDSHA